MVTDNVTIGYSTYNSMLLLVVELLLILLLQRLLLHLFNGRGTYDFLWLLLVLFSEVFNVEKYRDLEIRVRGQ